MNVRAFPKTRADVVGRVEVGQEFDTDGVRRNGFLHLIGTGFEAGDTWIYSGYVTDTPVTVQTIETEIKSNGRVACRRAIKGTRRKWVTNGQNAVIYAFCDDWAITDRGFIQTRFLRCFYGNDGE